MSKSVVVKNLLHRDMDCIGIFFPPDESLNSIARKIEGLKFSYTHRCWYIEYSEQAFDQVFQNFNNENVSVDYSNFKRKSFHPTASDQARDFAVDQVLKHLKLRGYSHNTINVYQDQFSQFLEFFPGILPESLNQDDIETYLLYLIEKKKVSKSTQNTAINSIKFYFEKVLNQERKVYYLARPQKEMKLPHVLSQEDVMAIISAPDNLKHRLMLMLIYSAGLRRSELLNLKVSDLDLARLTVRIEGGKGKKDRQSILAKSIIPFLKEYMVRYEPTHWLFYGPNGVQYSASSLQHILKLAVSKCQINRYVTLHTLRHSFATHLLESGTSTRYIQVLLGHESPKTTEIYAHVTRFGLDKLRSPLDQLPIEKRIE